MHLSLSWTIPHATASPSSLHASKETGMQLSQNISKLFWTQRSATHMASQASTPSSESDSQMTSWGTLSSQLIQPSSLLDVQKVALDIKNTLTAAILDLKSYIQAVAHCLSDVEQTSQAHATAIRQIQRTYDTQLTYLFYLHRHVEDLVNRSHIHYFRVRGVPEGIDAAVLQPTICSIFNDLIDRPADSPTDMERVHHPLSHQGMWSVAFSTFP